MNVIGKIIGKYLANLGDRLLCVSLPTRVGNEITRSIVDGANEVARSTRGFTNEPFAVEVIPDSIQPEEWQVQDSQVLEYRRGERLLAWLDGNFDPVRSLSSAKNQLIDPTFPGIQGEGFGIDTLSVEAAKWYREKYPDAMDPGLRNRLKDHLEYILNYGKDLLSEFGNTSDTWTAAWWRWAGMFLESLEHLLREQGDGQLTREQFFGAASFPVPDQERWSYSERLNPKEFKRIVEERFKNQETVDETLESGIYPGHVGISSLPWDNFWKVLVKEKHPVTTLFFLKQDKPEERINNWANTTEREFIGPLPPEGPRRLPLVVYSSGKPLAHLPWEQTTHILPVRSANIFENEEGKWIIEFPDVEFHAELNERIDPSSYRFDLDLGILDFEEDRPSSRKIVGDKGIIFCGKLSWTIKKKGSWPGKPIDIKIQGTQLSEMVNSSEFSLVGKVVLPAIEQHTLLHDKGSNKTEIFFPAGRQYKVDEDPSGDEIPIEFTDQDEPVLPLKEDIEEVDILGYDGYRTESPCGFFSVQPYKEADKYEPQGGEVNPNWDSLFRREKCPFYDGQEIRALNETEDLLLKVSIQEGSKDLPWLPLTATATGVTPRDDNPLPEMSEDVRGRIEDLLSSPLLELKKLPVNENPVGGFYQAVLPVGEENTWTRKEWVDAKPIWLGKPGTEKNIPNIHPEPSRAILEDPLTREFWNSAKKLLSKLIPREHETWISRCQLKDLDEADVNNYLETFKKMVEKAKSIRPSDGFYCSYPFSTVLVGQNIEAILLSPLHPLRLGWLYAAEKSVENHENSLPVIQMLEGWNFPWVGVVPAPGNKDVIYTSVPMDPGPEQVFLGWNILARFDNAQGSSPKIPPKACDVSMPGGSGSGLNEGGVESSLRDFMRIYPHLPMITVDIFSREKSGRSRSLDMGLIREAANMTRPEKESSGMILPGGLKVLDHKNRGGKCPTRDDAIGSLGKDTSPRDLKLTWERYNGNAAKPCDVRFIEDASARITRKEDAAPLGCLSSPWPIRRFAPRSIVADSAQVSETVVHLQITPGENEGNLVSFGRALQVFESSNEKNNALTISHEQTLLDSLQKARWTVTGNTFVDPSSLAQMVSSTNQMLWEWRPAYLPEKASKKGILKFERRPFTTISKIPQYFKEDIGKRVNQNDKRVEQVIKELGLRGVGLASLLAMGDNHVLGAFGFYFAYKLILKQKKNENGFRIVVPVDPIDGFIEATLDNTVKNETQRADLIIMDVLFNDPNKKNKNVEITLTPVEVTCRGYGDTGDPKGFPDVQTEAVKDKLGQLKSTYEVIKKLASSYNDHGKDNPILATAISVIVESSVLISNRSFDVNSISNLYQAVSSGNAELRVGRGVMFWFQPTPEQSNGYNDEDIKKGPTCCFVDPDKYDEHFWDTAT